MSKSLRLSEKWFRRGLWLVALVFASFLIGLGSTVVGDLPQVENTLTLEDFVDKSAAQQARTAIQAGEKTEKEVQDALEQARLKLQVAESDSSAARETFDQWVTTRRATERPEQDQELVKRTQALEALRARERKAQAVVEELDQKDLDTRQNLQRTRDQLAKVEEAGQQGLSQALRKQELRVFGYRLLLTLPLLAIAGWLFVKKRKSTAWPFVWGFIYFALFAFFVELVPYLPSYGGYVRYIVGIVITVLVGRQAIVGLNRYLERQKQAEALPDVVRREELDYDVALGRLAKGVCPGCERAVDLKDPANDFCPHCGIGLHAGCVQCGTRKSAFAKFCHACGTRAARPLPGV
ncbi:serine endopeptidase [Rhodoferax koreense]|uniref:Serine endopeptidase n=1 Tax=Rhodoferax koreensis TaxID=1842727 RepID=A0A1P8JR03_9BURK|nr:zinc ribbon domain-containing protein [Rhodoferax koreense]APW36161.1 serine endopeptidase [Rhodoferax koreense]